MGGGGAADPDVAAGASLASKGMASRWYGHNFGYRYIWRLACLTF